MYNGVPNSEFYRTAKQMPMSITTFMMDLILSFDLEKYKLFIGFFGPNGLFKQLFTSGFDQGPTV